jgi:hypothetical protein
MSYNPHHNNVAATGRTASGDELYRFAMLIVIVLVPIDSILGHTALNRVLESNVIVSWTLAVFVSMALAALAHIVGYLYARRAWIVGSLMTFAWFATIVGIGYVRWNSSAPSQASSGGLSMDSAAPVTQSGHHTQVSATTLMVAVFVLTGALSAFAGAHRSPQVDARKKALASVRATEAELKQAESDLKRAEQLHASHLHQLDQIDMEAARAIQAQRQVTQILTVRAAIALREKTGDASNDFHLQAPAKPVPNPETERLLAQLAAGVEEEGRRG